MRGLMGRLAIVVLLQLHCWYPCFAALPFVVHVALIAERRGGHQSGQTTNTCWGIEDTRAEATRFDLNAQIKRLLKMLSIRE